MNRLRLFLVVTMMVGAMLPAVAVLADDSPPPPPQGWSGKASAGYVLSRGTSDTDSANASLDVGDLAGDWKHLIHVEALYGRSGEVTSADRWAGLYQANYAFTPRAFVFGALHYVHDEFSGFQYQGDLTTGLGYKLLDTTSDQLTAQAGIGYRRLRPEFLDMDTSGAVIARTPAAATGNAIGTAGFDFAHSFNASTKITDKFLLAGGAGNTSLENDLALLVHMSKTLSLSAGFTFLENTEPPAGLKKVNTLTTLNLVYAFTP